MATHKAKVTGPFPVNGVAPGGKVVLDDELVNLPALLAARLVELVPAPKSKKKGDH
jgi:hypothetical protein